jgi:hypothetical protein
MIKNNINNFTSWLSPSGEFHSVSRTHSTGRWGTHSDWASHHGMKIQDMFNKGWMRVTYIGDILYMSNDSGVFPNYKQKSAILNLAIESDRFKKVVYEDGQGNERELNEYYSFRIWLEELDIDKEETGVRDLNMTAKLPLYRNNPLGNISNLTRGFHLNTIVGRMLRPWINIIKLFEDKKDAVTRRLPDLTDEIFGINKKYINKDGLLNSNFLSAYDLFKDELSRSINNLPYKLGKDVHSGEYVDPLSPTKAFLKKYDNEDDFLESLDKALDISLMVMGHSSEQVRNFINFLEIVRDEFITIGERLPTLGEPSLEGANKELLRSINKKLKEYEKLYKSNI